MRCGIVSLVPSGDEERPYVTMKGLTRRRPPAYSAASRTPIPEQAEQRFRRQAEHFSGPAAESLGGPIEAAHGEGSPDSPRPDQDEEGAVAHRRLSMRRIREILRLNDDGSIVIVLADSESKSHDIILERLLPIRRLASCMCSAFGRG